MTRAIKFRAWDTESKSYFEVDTARWDLGGELVGVSCHLSEIETKHLPAKQIVIEQFCGLTDRNGRDIYEGDIIKTHYIPSTVDGVAQDTEVSEVTWLDILSGFGDKNALSVGYYFRKNDVYEIEVIGNVHQNPELLTH